VEKFLFNFGSMPRSFSASLFAGDVKELIEDIGDRINSLKEKDAKIIECFQK